MRIHVSFRNMKVTLKCNHDKIEPEFTAEGEKVTLEYVRKYCSYGMYTYSV